EFRQAAHAQDDELLSAGLGQRERHLSSRDPALAPCGSCRIDRLGGPARPVVVHATVTGRVTPISARARFKQFALLALLALPGRLTAQDVNVRVDRWALGTELGLNAARGNSSYTMLTSGLRLTHLNKKLFELDWAS